MATSVENVLLFDMGLCNSFPFIIIAALTGFPNKHNVHESLSLTPIEASWLGNHSFFFQFNLTNILSTFFLNLSFFFFKFYNLIGSIGFVSEPIGSVLSALITGKTIKLTHDPPC